MRQWMSGLRAAFLGWPEETRRFKRKFANFGDNARIFSPSLISGHGHIAVGADTAILSYSRLQCFGQLPGSPPAITIGTHCYIGHRFSILAGARISIGNWVLIASDVMITSEGHGINPESELQYMEQLLSMAPVEIGDGCWIGEKVCILPGVTIGTKAIIGAGSVVTKSIPSYSIAVGNPAKVIKNFDFSSHKWVSC